MIIFFKNCLIAARNACVYVSTILFGNLLSHDCIGPVWTYSRQARTRLRFSHFEVVNRKCLLLNHIIVCEFVKFTGINVSHQFRRLFFRLLNNQVVILFYNLYARRYEIVHKFMYGYNLSKYVLPAGRFVMSVCVLSLLLFY